jgi:hypothetical protein
MKRSLTSNESGMAIITALLVLMLTSGLMAGMFAALLANQRSHSTDRDQSVAYAAAHAGLEKLTASLATLFVTDFSPSAAQIGVIDNTPPAITGFEYTAPGGAAGSGYQVTFTPDPGPGPNTGNPLASVSADITTGPFEGFKGVITPYVVTVTARSVTGNSEVRLRRELQTVAVPVFQFGIFGEKSLGFHAGPDFDFGGRVHTNQSLYVAAGNGNTLTFRDKITAFTQVVRNTLSNGVSIALTNHEGTVMLPTVIGGAPLTYRALASTENSGTTATPWAGWKSLSESTYHANVRTEATGAKSLNLPLATAGATPIDLIRRPVVLSNEDTANAAVFGQRYFAQASLRILLSDRSTDLTNLPTIVTATAPVDLANLAASGYAVAAGRPPVAVSPQADLFDPADGTSLTRLNGNPGAQPATLTIETKAAGAAWGTAVNGVPAWLRWTSITTPAGPLTCTGLTSTLLSGCAAGAGHPAIANNTVVTFTRPDGSTVTALVNGAAALNSATIAIDTFTTAQNFVATRTFFVGEDPVTCTGMTASTLTGCTWPAGTTLADDDPVYSGASTTAGTPLVHGFLKIEKQNAAGVWSDVTMELLNLGFAGPNQQGILCADPTPNAVIRLQRLRDNGMTTAGACNAGQAGSYTGSLAATDFWPNTIFDAREGGSRLIATNSGMNVGGVFSYAALDAGNLARWFAGAIGTTGNQALNNNGYIVYFSDRRGDHNEDHATVPDIETGEYGFEDSVNPAAAAWAKNNVLDAGEDFNENLTLESYGETPHPLVGYANAIANMRFNSASRPWDSIPLLYSGRGRLARPVLFRRALKLTNGGMVAGVSNNLPASGLTVTAENPVYVQGNYNATAASVTAEPNVAAAIIADAITLLSNAFTDAMTFQYPNDRSLRDATTTGYRFAMETGKTIPFPKPAAWGVQELGSDGGVHNFMKMLEDWGGQTLRYRGSMVSLYYSRQAIGIYRADGNTYGAPTRGYNFDTDFLIPALLPPGTPMFRDINTLKFRQILRPNQ